MRKQKYKPKPFESRGEKYTNSKGKQAADTSANIYESMLTAPAFIALKPRQQILYIYLKAQYYGHRKPSKDYPGVDKFKDDACFYFSWDQAQEYQLYKPSMSRDFYRDIKALQTAGFIKLLASGKSQHKRNIYQFDDGWYEHPKEEKKQEKK